MSSWQPWLKSLDQLRDDFGIPGVAVAHLADDDVQIAGLGLRNIRRGLAVTPQTIFHIASTQKSMTSMFIATLVDDGLLDWDQPVIEVAPQLRLEDKAATRAITIRHLLSMTSGIPASAEDRFDVERKTAEDLFRYVQRVKLRGRPGARFAYSNVSYALAGYIGVLAAGGTWGRLEEEFHRLMTERIFEPIGLSNATFNVRQARSSPDYSVAYEYDRNRVVVAESEDASHDPLAPAGGVKTNITDMARFLRTQLQQGVSPENRRVVSAENLRETWKPHSTDPDGGDYALGWGVEHKRRKTILSHEGSYDGFLAQIVMIPEDRKGLVVLANMEDEEDEFLYEVYGEWLAHFL